jgi:DNA repair protein RadC
MSRGTPIENIRSEERPRERCLSWGPQCLSLRECIALVLNSGPPKIGCLGLATAILQRQGSGLKTEEEERAFFSAMEISPNAHLSEIRGLGPAGRARLLAAFELGRRYSIFRERTAVSPETATKGGQQGDEALSRIPQELRSEPQEWLGFVPRYRNGQVGQFCLVERGVRTHVNVDPMELFARLLALRPSGFFLFHNHPSGDLNASSEDQTLTSRVAELSGSFGMRLLGHGIVAARGEAWVDGRYLLC